MAAVVVVFMAVAGNRTSSLEMTKKTTLVFQEEKERNSISPSARNVGGGHKSRPLSPCPRHHNQQQAVIRRKRPDTSEDSYEGSIGFDCASVVRTAFDRRGVVVLERCWSHLPLY